MVTGAEKIATSGWKLFWWKLVCLSSLYIDSRRYWCTTYWRISVPGLALRVIRGNRYLVHVHIYRKKWTTVQHVLRWQPREPADTREFGNNRHISWATVACKKKNGPVFSWAIGWSVLVSTGDLFVCLFVSQKRPEHVGYFIAVSNERREVIVSIRGTESLSDVIFDAGNLIVMVREKNTRAHTHTWYVL